MQHFCRTHSFMCRNVKLGGRSHPVRIVQHRHPVPQPASHHVASSPPLTRIRLPSSVPFVSTLQIPLVNPSRPPQDGR